LDLGTVNQPHICDIIKSLKSKGSLDIDGISTNLLKAIKIEISTPLAHIFKLSLETGIFPSKLKISRTVPIFKAGDPKLCDNYRPIALLSAMSKILEKVVSIQLVNHLDRNNLIYEHQYGFQRSKSTEHSLVHAVNFIGNAMNENKYALGVFFDLKKAFDVCSHEILLMKLERMGVRDTALLWFRNYLSNRKQIVDINGHRSDEKGIEISILQGSILGPILFLIYINDLHSVTSLLSLMFADDTFCLKSGPVLNTLIIDVNNEINKMALWFRADENLTLDKHIKHLANKLSRAMYCIKRPKNALNLKGMISLYYALIHSHLTYCPIILACTSKANITRIHKIQKKALRIITQSTYNAHTGPICIALNILPFNKIITLAQMLFMHSIEYNYAPSSFNNIWRKINERELNVTLRNNDRYITPYPRIDIFKRTPLYACPNEWNQGGDIIHQNNRITFSIALKDKLLCELEEEHIQTNMQ